MKTSIFLKEETTIVVLITMICCLLSSCSKSELLPGSKWLLQALKPASEELWIESEKEYTLELQGDGRYIFRLDANACTGSWTSTGSKIRFKDSACTEICCDSAIALQFSSALIHVLNYRIDGSTLWLSGRDSIRAMKKE
jgi:heat shock protein HslJ